MGMFMNEALVEEDGMASDVQGGEPARNPAVLKRLWN
jgi:hypothetical protein